MKLGVSLSRSYINSEAFEQCKKAGIDGIEISLGRIEDVEDFDFSFAKSLADVQRKTSFKKFSFGVPLAPL